MRTVTERLLKSFNRDQMSREIEEELRFHLDWLTDELCRQEASLEQARDTARQRFGNVEQIKNQCVEIRRRSRPAIRALKLLLVLVFLFGVLVRVFSPEYHVTRIGDILITVGILGRLLLYVRGLNPSGFLSKSETLSLMLNEKSQSAFTSYDEKKLTPVERVIFNK